MITVPLRSSLLTQASYDERRHELQVWFHSSAVKTYTGIPRTIWLRLVRAKSHGKFFLKTIQGKFSQVSETRCTARGDGSLKRNRPAIVPRARTRKQQAGTICTEVSL